MPQSAVAFEQINSFDSHITVQPNTAIKIEERIQYETTVSRHGIYRYVPLRYSRAGTNYTTRISGVMVKDERGKNIPYERSQSNGNMVLKIGDADETFLGKKTYTIFYTVENAVQEVSVDGNSQLVPELYWDITGEGWQIEIASTSATIDSPGATQTHRVCYAGNFGEDDGKCLATASGATSTHLVYQEPVSYGDNVTVAIAFDPKGNWAFPSPLQKLLKQVQDSFIFTPVLLPMLVMLGWWWRKGRDTEYVSWNVFNDDPTQPQRKSPLWQRRPIPMVYEPFKTLTPGEAGVLLDGRVDSADIIAEIIELARLKYLSIKRVEKKKLFGSSQDYTFTKLKEAKSLPAHQEYLFKKLFTSGQTVRLSSLKGSFSTEMEQTKKLLYTAVTSKGFYTANPQSVRDGSMLLVIVLLIVAAGWGIHLLELELWLAIPVFIISAGVSIALIFKMPAKTALGSNHFWQVKGLKTSIARGSWREKIKEKHLFFEEVLPFAVALGVVDQLSRDMEDLNVKAPEYVAGSSLQYFSTQAFVDSFTTEAASSLSYNPSSSSWSSGSGSSGGSSGGGGGGGGGGSW